MGINIGELKKELSKVPDECVLDILVDDKGNASLVGIKRNPDTLKVDISMSYSILKFKIELVGKSKSKN